MVQITEISKEQFHIVINGVSIGTLEKSEIREIIQALDNGVHH